MFEKMEYQVARIDGDYAYLQSMDNQKEELRCVARALLPETIDEGSYLVYEMLEYKLKENGGC